MTTAFATTVKVGDHYRIKMNRGAERSGYYLKSDNRDAIRNEWLNRPEAKAAPFIYGYRPTSEDTDGRVTAATGWARYNERLFAIFYRVYWSKDGTQCTVQISTRRKVADGLVWASGRYVADHAPSSISTAFLHAVAAAIVKNNEIESANALGATAEVRLPGQPRVERKVRKEDWSE